AVSHSRSASAGSAGAGAAGSGCGSGSGSGAVISGSDSGAGAAFRFRLKETSFFQIDFFGSLGASGASARSAFGFRLKEISFFQIDCLGSSIAGLLRLGDAQAALERRRLRIAARLVLADEAHALEQAFELVAPARGAERLLLRDDPPQRQLGERLLHRLHAAARCGLHHGVDLLDLPLADEVPDGVVGE